MNQFQQMLKPIETLNPEGDMKQFDRNDLSGNPLTVQEWQGFARSQLSGRGIGNWERAARWFAQARQTPTMVLKGDDTMVVFAPDGETVRKTTHKSHEWSWT